MADIGRELEDIAGQAAGKISDLEQEVEDLNDENNGLRDEIDNLNQEIEELKAELEQFRGEDSANISAWENLNKIDYETY